MEMFLSLFFMSYEFYFIFLIQWQFVSIACLPAEVALYWDLYYDSNQSSYYLFLCFKNIFEKN
jgi:hypothetical protein